METMKITESTWVDYRETVYGKVNDDWFWKHIIDPAIEHDDTVSPWDTWRIVGRNGGFQAQIRRVV